MCRFASVVFATVCAISTFFPPLLFPTYSQYIIFFERWETKRCAVGKAQQGKIAFLKKNRTPHILLRVEKENNKNKLCTVFLKTWLY